MRAFCRVADAGSFAKAADSLDAGPATVTRLIADLEEHLGTRLINRTTRKLALTPVGEQYLERVRSILDDLEDAESLASSASTELRGRLSVLSPASFAVHKLARNLGGFHEVYPHVTVDLTISDTV
jgi:DNA-binding transcriptional LysR family regulator